MSFYKIMPFLTALGFREKNIGTSVSCCSISGLGTGSDSGSGSGSGGAAGVAASGGKRSDSKAGASTSRHGLPGIMPADFAAWSIAPKVKVTNQSLQKKRHLFYNTNNYTKKNS